MVETITEMIVPGTYIEVRPEGLIGVSGIVTGNIGIIGTAAKGALYKPITLSSYTEVTEEFGEYDPWKGGKNNELTLARALEQIYNNNGAATVIAVRVASSTAKEANYSLKSSTGICAKLIAKTPGTWGNEIKVNVFEAKEDLFIKNEEHICNGNPITLNRNNIKESNRNQLIVKNDTTGEITNFNITYGISDLESGKVHITKSSGRLKFYNEGETGDQTPKTGNTLVVSYRIDKNACVNIKIIYKSSTEEYNVPDGDYLVHEINESSKLVNAENGTEEIPTKFESKEIFEKFGTGTNQTGDNGAQAGVNEYNKGMQKLEEQPVNIVLAAGLPFDVIQSDLVAHCETTENLNRERIALVGSGSGDDVDRILNYSDKISDDRVILVAPGIKSRDSVSKKEVTLPGSYSAAAVAGKISSLPIHVTPTNKTLSLAGLEEDYSYGTLKNLINNRVLVINERRGFRIVRGITTDDGAFKQISIRRIVDYTKEGIRIGSLPYIGRLNNSRVRAALRATLDSFLSRMVLNEQLTEYTLNVSATRQEEINGICRIETTLKPTFSIDFIRVIMTLE